MAVTACRRRPTSPTLTLAVTCLAVAMVQLDTTMVNLALRPIQSGLHAGLGAAQWVLDSYNVVYASPILTGAAPFRRGAPAWPRPLNVARMVGAALGVAVLGAVFSAAGGGDLGGLGSAGGQTSAQSFTHGMHVALSVGGAAQLVGAALAAVFVTRQSVRRTRDGR